MEEKQYPVMSVARSYSRKVPGTVTGGDRYSTTDFFASRSHSWFYTPEAEEVKSTSEALYQDCVKEVEDAIAAVVAKAPAQKPTFPAKTYPPRSYPARTYPQAKRWDFDDTEKTGIRPDEKVPTIKHPE